MYLASSTYPDILFAVHQCKQFIKNPKRCHEEAIKRIGRYPKATHDKGIIYKPSNTNQLGCYVDADFADCFTEEISHLKTSLLSRTCCIIFPNGYPLVFISKKHEMIAISTTVAKYIDLSQSMRDLLPLRTILLELSRILVL